MNLIQYEQYFNQIPIHFVLVSSFYHIDLIDEYESFIADLRSMKYKTPLLVLESYDLDTIAEKHDNIHDSFDGALLILDRFDVRNLTPYQRVTFLSEKEYIMKQIRRKMLEDKKAHLPEMQGLVADSFKIRKTELIASTYKGFRMTFRIEAPDNEPLSPQLWI